MAAWHPLVWLGAAVAGYALFMRWHPLHGVFADAWRTARRNAGLWLLVGALLALHELWRFGQADTQVARAIGDPFQQWIGFAWRDLRSVFWVGVPLEAAFVAGVPLALVTLFYWVPRIWRVSALWKGRWLACGALLGVWFVALWWWVRTMAERFSWHYPQVPEGRMAESLLRFLGEGVAAVAVACFVQACLWCGAYYSHAVGSGTCRLREAADLAFRFTPAVLAVCVVYGLALGVHAQLAVPLGMASAPGWEVGVLVLIIATGSLPLALILLPGENFLAKLQVGGRFLLRTLWRYAWFVFVALVHFTFLRTLDDGLRGHFMDHPYPLLAWRMASAALRAWLIVWLVNAFCLYFCMDAKHAVQLTASRKPKPRKRANAKKKAAKSRRALRLMPRRAEPLTT